MAPGQSSPIILLQPRTTLHTLFPGPQYANELSLLEERTYVGIIGDSLFAMSHTNFPLVSVDYRFSPSRPIGNKGTDHAKEVGLPLMERECTAYGCLVGTRASRGDSASSRFSRLIEAKPPKLLIDGPAADGMTGLPLLLSGGQSPSLWTEYGVQSIILAFCALLGYAAFSSRRTTPRTKASPKFEADTLSAPYETVSNPATEVQEQVTPKLSVVFTDPIPKTAADEGIGDHSDGEGDGDGEVEGEDFKRRRRRRRSRKKFKGDPNGAPPGPDEPGNVGTSEPADANPAQAQSSEREDYVVVPITVAEVTSPAPASASMPESQNFSLAVSDVVLGQSPSILSHSSHF